MKKEKLKSNVKGKNGITLIALVITVVVMLILAGVSINVFIMDGGIMDKFKTAINIDRERKESEKNQINTIEEWLSRYSFDIWDGISIAENFESGDGTEENPYLIKTAPQLIYFREQVNSGVDFEGKYIKLGANIELNSDKWRVDSNKNIIFDEEAIEWIPIVSGEDKFFKGNFNGEDYIISGLYINDTSQNNQALFGKNDGVIENLIIENSYVKGYIRSSIAVADNNGIISNISVKNSNVVGYDFISGICARNKNQIIGCSNYANLSFYKPVDEAEDLWGWRIGGICGQQDGVNTSITQCANYGKVEGTHNTGGIAGSANGGTISLCVNTGEVKTYLSGRSGQSGGGIIGYATR